MLLCDIYIDIVSSVAWHCMTLMSIVLDGGGLCDIYASSVIRHCMTFWLVSSNACNCVALHDIYVNCVGWGGIA